MKTLLFLFVFLLITSLSFSQSNDFRKKNFNVKKDIILEGYDAVSYFDGKPTEGKPEFKFIYGGIVYQFSSLANLNKFKASPARYEPAYGGWCAYAMGETGEKVKIDPETFKILDGKLYVFYNFWGTNTLEDWNKNEQKLKEAGDRNWKKISP